MTPPVLEPNVGWAFGNVFLSQLDDLFRWQREVCRFYSDQLAEDSWDLY